MSSFCSWVLHNVFAKQFIIFVWEVTPCIYILNRELKQSVIKSVWYVHFVIFSSCTSCSDTRQSTFLPKCQGVPTADCAGIRANCAAPSRNITALSLWKIQSRMWEKHRGSRAFHLFDFQMVLVQGHDCACVFVLCSFIVPYSCFFSGCGTSLYICY